MIDPMPMFKRHIANLQEKSNNQWTGLCPYHNDTKNSFSINAVTGQWNCFACGVDGNAITFAKDKGENWKDYISDDYKALDLSKYKRVYKKPEKQEENRNETNGEQRGKADKYNYDLVRSRAKECFERVNYPKDVNGYTPFIKNQVGKHTNGATTFPYFDKDMNIVGLKYHKPKVEDIPSHWDRNGQGSKRWYNDWNTPHYNNPIHIFTEGEKDSNRLLALGFNNWSTSAGVMSIPSFSKSQVSYLKSKEKIFILYDNDKYGEKGAEKLAQHLYTALKIEAYICVWRDGLHNGYDAFDDLTGEEVKYAVDNAFKFKPKQGISEADPCPPKEGYKIMSVTKAVGLNIEKPAMIVEDLLSANGSLLLCAEDNVGKSMMANQLGMCIAQGKDFLNYKVPEKRKVLLVQHEMENGEQYDRLSKQMVNEDLELLDKNLQTNFIEESDRLAITDQFEMLGLTFSNNPDIEVCVFDNIGQSTNVNMSDPNEIRQELKRLKDLCRQHSVAFILVAHLNKIKWAEACDLLKNQIQGGKPVTDWADNVLQLHTSSLNAGLILFKINKVRHIYNDEGISTKYLNQGVWFNQDKDLLFKNRFTLNNWEMHFKSLDKYEQETEFIKKIAEYPQPFSRLDAINVGNVMEVEVSPATIDRWLKKLVKPMRWLNKAQYGKYEINTRVMDYIQVCED